MGARTMQGDVGVVCAALSKSVVFVRSGRCTQFWPCSTIEATRRRPKTPLKPTAECGSRPHYMRSAMDSHDFETMSMDELWSLQEEVVAFLASKLLAEKARLDQQLRLLLGPHAAQANTNEIRHTRRPYPPVFPKYRNPAQPSETWAGRGKQPRWLIAQLRSGKQLDDFRIQPPSDRARRRARQ